MNDNEPGIWYADWPQPDQLPEQPYGLGVDISSLPAPTIQCPFCPESTNDLARHLAIDHLGYSAALWEEQYQ